MAPEIEVAIGVLTELRQGEMAVLIARRPDETVLGGYWEFPGGKRRAEESFEQCLVREFAEELGLVIEVTSSLDSLRHDYPHGRVRLQPFLCRRVEGEAQNLGVSEHRWVAPRELSDYPFPPANDKLLAHLADLLAPG